MKISSPFLIAACVILLSITARAQSVVITPDRLVEGDGNTRNITLEATVAPGAQLTVAVSYSSGPTAPVPGFIPKFSVRDNSGEDKDPRDGRIRLVLPKPFEKTGVYVIEVESPRTILRLVHASGGSSYLGQFVHLFASATGIERGSGRKSARERIEEVTKNQAQEKLAIWTAPLPAIGEEISRDSRDLKIRGALMPSWSRTGNQLACSAWRNGKWTISGYAINPAGAAAQLWQWNSRIDQASDFSPAWSPNDDAIAFVRLRPDRRSDIWILQLDRNQQPKRELKLTDIGNVHAVLAWDKDLGLVFETQAEQAGQPNWRQIWAARVTAQETGGGKIQPSPLSDSYNVVTGTAPVRQTLIFAQENEGPPISVLFEISPGGKRWPLLMGDFCSYKWPTVSHDEKWLAFDFDCPR
jgi:hypothetical protein